MKFRVCEARAQCHNMDSLRSECRGESLRQRDQVGLGRSVTVVALNRHAAGDRRHVDNTPETLFGHARHELMTHCRDRGHHQAQVAVVQVPVAFPNQIRAFSAGIVDQVVNPQSHFTDRVE